MRTLILAPFFLLMWYALIHSHNNGTKKANKEKLRILSLIRHDRKKVGKQEKSTWKMEKPKA